MRNTEKNLPLKGSLVLGDKMAAPQQVETIRGMGTSFRHNDFWDHLGGQALVMIGRWYSRQPLANHN